MVVNLVEVGIGDFVAGFPAECGAEIFKDIEDAVAEIAFEIRLSGKRLLMDLIEQNVPGVITYK